MTMMNTVAATPYARGVVREIAARGKHIGIHTRASLLEKLFVGSFAGARRRSGILATNALWVRGVRTP